jgi:2-keto-myo-inositol isomerase
MKFGFNHMVSPSLTPEALVDAAVQAGAVAIELRNDIGANSIRDVDTARRVGAKAVDRGLEVRSVNALYPFNVWNDERARQTESLAKLAAACGAIGLVMCPLNEGKMLEDTPEKAASLRAALKGARAILGEYGLKGFVEPLGFPISSLRFKREALAAIDDIRGADVFSVVHDTFHHRGAGERDVFAARTGLVHISGLEDPTVSFADMLDGHRVLVGPKDRLGNIEQLRQLYADGFDGIVSFEPFAKEVHDLALPIAAVRTSMAYVREALAAS